MQECVKFHFFILIFFSIYRNKYTTILLFFKVKFVVPYSRSSYCEYLGWTRKKEELGGLFEAI
ncbi:MAG: hypothetical protein A2321_03275 [Omnitrophica WOR_2 bacterium RIFOXYB2_FULL_45_11]|nr:MAG: hypothetical protein A2321_03275 [Omnitrophica WOR_2 bacterium RIFOXYB2_FULL_45_11]